MAKKKAAKKKASKKRAEVGTATAPRAKAGLMTQEDDNRRPPPDLTWELVEELAETVGQGNFRSTAAQRAGIHSERFSRWLSMGKRDLKLHAKGKLEGALNMYCHLVIAMEKAEGAAHGDILQDILKFGDPSTKLKFLQLRYNKIYSKNPNARIDDEDGSIQKISAKEVLLDMLGSFLDSDDLPAKP